MIRTFTAAMLAAILAVSATPVFAEMAHDAMATPDATTLGDLVITGAFTRATLPNAQIGGGYLTIENTGTQDETLVSATSPLSGDVQIHQMAMVGEIMEMRELADGIAIPAGETVELAPGGLHLMMTEITQPFVEGETVPVTLTFAQAGPIEITLSVQSFGAAAIARDHAGH